MSEIWMCPRKPMVEARYSPEGTAEYYEWAWNFGGSWSSAVAHNPEWKQEKILSTDAGQNVITIRTRKDCWRILSEYYYNSNEKRLSTNARQNHITIQTKQKCQKILRKISLFKQAKSKEAKVCNLSFWQDWATHSQCQTTVQLKFLSCSCRHKKPSSVKQHTHTHLALFNSTPNPSPSPPPRGLGKATSHSRGKTLGMSAVISFTFLVKASNQ